MIHFTNAFNETYRWHDIGPAFHGDALKDSEHGVAYIIKGGDTEVGSLPIALADISIGADKGSRQSALTSTMGVICYHAGHQSRYSGYGVGKLLGITYG